MTDALFPEAAEAATVRGATGDGQPAPPTDDVAPSGASDTREGLDPDVVAALMRRAAAGDREAAGAYFAEMLPSLTLTARRIAGTSHDADDLLSEALLVVLSKWLEGTGPTDNTPAYIAQIMRNRIRDDFRSPRSRVAALDNVEEPASNADPRIRELEIESELVVVRRALAALPADQQRVLVATVLEGRKPRDLEEHMARPASAIYSLTRRAKGNLRRTTLRLLLEDGGRPECVSAAQTLPDTVGDSAEQTRNDPAAEHHGHCPHCRRSWKRFAGLATLGIVPVAAGITLASPADSASASVAPAGSPAQDGSPAASATTPAVPDAAHAAPAGHGVSAPKGRATPRWHDGVRTAVMVGAAGTALVLVSTLAVTFVTRTWFFAPTPPGALDLTASAAGPGVAAFDMALSVEQGSWTVGTLRIDLSTDIDAVEPPDGWTCLVDAGDATCTTALESPRGGVFEVAHDVGEAVAYEFVLDGTSEGGASLSGHAAGVIPD